jgi:hypothetical protein
MIAFLFFSFFPFSSYLYSYLFRSIFVYDLREIKYTHSFFNYDLKYADNSFSVVKF